MKRDAPSYHGYCFPPKIISHAVWLYHRFGVSFRDVEDLLAQRGITVSYETIRLWCLTFGAAYARRLTRRQGRLGDTWHLDEVFVTIQGQRHYLWRAVDQDGDVIDILVQSRRDCRAATRFFRRLLKGQERQPRRLVTDKPACGHQTGGTSAMTPHDTGSTGTPGTPRATAPPARTFGPQGPTLGELSDAYLQDYQVRQFRSQSTARGRIAHLTACFGRAAHAAALTTYQIRQYQLARRAAGAATGTINRETSALHRMCTLAVHWGWLDTVPGFGADLHAALVRDRAANP